MTVRLTTLLIALLIVRCPAMAQTPRDVANDERERAVVETLRREDPAAADRYVALRDAREQAVADVEIAQSRYRAAGVELRSVVLPQLLQARRGYAAASLALLDFFDSRDREAVSRYQREITRINGIVEERKRARAEFERMLKE